MASVAIVTSNAIRELMPDDQGLIGALNKIHARNDVCVWTDPIDWAKYDLVLVRSPWDYTDHAGAFIAWAQRVNGLTRLVNSASTLSWNTHKSYLRSFDARGVPTIPTVWVDRSPKPPLLRALMQTHGWNDVVYKPCVGSGSSGAARCNTSQAEQAQDRFQELCAQQDVMLQPYMHAVETHGELSLIYFDGVFSHAIRKLAPSNPHAFEPRAKARFEVTAANTADIELGEKAIGLAPDSTTYARVDMLFDAGIQSCRVVEVEAIEPMLYLEAGNATERFARTIRNQI